MRDSLTGVAFLYYGKSGRRGMHLEEFIQKVEPALGDEFVWRLDFSRELPKFEVRGKYSGGHVFSIHTTHIANGNEINIHGWEKDIEHLCESVREREREDSCRGSEHGIE